MNAHARKTLEAIEPKIQEVFQLNVDDMQGGSIHRFHRDPKKVESILRNPSALPHEADFEFGDIILRTVINAVCDETGQLEAYVVSWEDATESKKLERALNIKLKELNDANQELLKRNLQIKQDEAELKDAHEEQVRMHAYLNVKLAELRQSNQDLESFATIASHDLMAPVRKIINFAGALLENSVRFSENDKFLLDKIINSEKIFYMDKSLGSFSQRVKNSAKIIREFLNLLKMNKKIVVGYGASTKGNIILNYSKIDKKLLNYICDENPLKINKRVTPGTRINIISKEAMRKKKCDYLFVLIWSFRKEVIKQEVAFIKKGGKLIIPLPVLHIIDKSNYKDYLNRNLSDFAFKL